MHSVLQVVLYSVTGIVVVAISNSKEIKHTYTTITGEQQAVSGKRMVKGECPFLCKLLAIQNSSYTLHDSCFIDLVAGCVGMQNAVL